MKLPDNLSQHFFAYGIFKPGELAFLQIKSSVNNCEPCSISGKLFIRDGLPIASPPQHRSERISGAIIKFRPGSEARAYQLIADLEPDKQYQWAEASTAHGHVNYLTGRSPAKGSTPLEMDEEWSGRNDPLFTVALEVVEETLRQNRDFNWDLKPLFRLEMAYLLLWTVIERYVSFRYSLDGERATKKIEKVADEPAFQETLRDLVKEKREVFRADRPNEKIVLDVEHPKNAVLYYYQIRNNLVHRGKGVPHDHERMEKSIQELLAIFRQVLAAAFEESKWL